MALLSVVIANYNYGRFLEEAILSVVSQEGFNQCELIVVDGGSTDGSVDIIKKYADKIAWWVSERDSGQSSAFNKGYAHATGHFLTWLNADDILLPGQVLALRNAHLKDPSCRWFAGGGMVWCNENMVIEDVSVAHRFSRRRQKTHSLTVAGPSSFFEAALLKEVGGVDESLHFIMDIDLWTKFAKLGVRYKRLEGLTWAYRNHSASKMSGPAVDPHSEESVRKRKLLRGEQEILNERYGDGGVWRWTCRWPISILDVLRAAWLRKKYRGRSVNVLGRLLVRKPRVLLSNSFQEYITGLLEVPCRVYTFNTFYRKTFRSDGDLVVLDNSLRDNSDPSVLATYIDAESIDTLYAQGFGSMLYLWRVRRRCRHVRPKLLVTCHSPDVWESAGRTLAFVFCAMALTDGVVFLVEETRRKWRWLARLFRRETWHIPNAIDLTRFQSRSLPETIKDPVLGVIGVLSPRKRQDLIVEVVNRLRKQGINASLRIAGDVSRGNDAYAERLKQQCNEAGLTDVVRFDGRIPYDEVPNWFKGVDLYICASDGEVMPFSILEAMASGLPVVAHDIAGIHEEVFDGETGFLVAESSPGSYVSCVKKLLSKGVAAKMGARGRRQVESGFTMGVFSGRMGKLFV